MAVWKDLCPKQTNICPLSLEPHGVDTPRSKIIKREARKHQGQLLPAFPLEQEKPVFLQFTMRRSSIRLRRSGSNQTWRISLTNLRKYSNILAERPKTARLQQSKYVANIVRSMNALLNEQLKNYRNLEETIDVMYAGAATVCEIHLMVFDYR